MTSTDIEIGPVDIIVIGYPKGAPLTGEAAGIMIDLVERGIIRVLDVLFVLKNEDGSYSGLTASDLDAEKVGDLVVFEGASSGMLGDEDVETAASALEPGEAAAVIMFENAWAAPFIAAVRRNGGQLLDAQRIPATEFLEAIERLELD